MRPASPERQGLRRGSRAPVADLALVAGLEKLSVHMGDVRIRPADHRRRGLSLQVAVIRRTAAQNIARGLDTKDQAPLAAGGALGVVRDHDAQTMFSSACRFSTVTAWIARRRAAG
jgi:hypothetical protein